MPSGHATFDIVIAGASYAGLALAKALAVAGNDELRIALVDPKPMQKRGDRAADARAFALSAGSRHLFEHIGIWAQLEHDSQAVERIEITDSALDAGIRPKLLGWDNILQDGEPASYIIPADLVTAALQIAVDQTPGILQFHEVGIEHFAPDPRYQHITLSDGTELRCTVLVAADGQNSKIREKADIAVVKWPYQQTGIVTTIRHSKPHEATALQHFLPGGPFAILPLRGNQSCITWSEADEVAKRILAASDEDFIRELDKRLAGRMGRFEVTGSKQAWPLSMHLARTYIAERLVLVGDAAHGVHPIAGQGLNLGLRDVAALVDVWIDSARLGFDIGRTDVLERYQQWRRGDGAQNAFAFDALNRIFSNNVPLLRSFREFGLGGIDRLAGLKPYFVHEAAGQTGEVPSLMRKVTGKSVRN